MNYLRIFGVSSKATEKPPKTKVLTNISVRIFAVNGKYDSESEEQQSTFSKN